MTYFPWGSRIIIGKNGDRAEVIERHDSYLRENSNLHSRLADLRSKVPGCWCYPDPCHGDVSIRQANGV
jgi:hypothetical protein